jgi:hypothetical protein
MLPLPGRLILFWLPAGFGRQLTGSRRRTEEHLLDFEFLLHRLITPTAGKDLLPSLLVLRNLQAGMQSKEVF